MMVIMSGENKQERMALSGIFSSQEVRKVGTGTTTRKSIQKMYWSVNETPEGQIELQPLNTNYIPSGPKRMVNMDDFLQKFSPEPEFYISNVYPKIKEVNKTVARADRHRANGELFSAEMEYNNALRIDEENIRANFGLGITYLERGENSKAEDILGRLVKLEGAFETQHKHLFNDFGISLRKNNMFSQAISYYSRAMELTSQDENLYYNVARACLENKEPDKAASYLLKGLEINPAQEVLIKFLVWLLTKNLIPDGLKPQAAQALKVAKEAIQAVAQTAEAPEENPDQSAPQAIDKNTASQGLQAGE